MSRRVVIVGLDGGAWPVLDGFMRSGSMPNLKSLVEGGYRADLRSTNPPITPVAWASFATGMNPGRHGVFGFAAQQSAPGEYLPPPARRDAIASPSLWRRLSDHGLTSIVLSVPLTYPPEPIRGSMVTGMFTPGPHSRCTHPPGLKRELVEEGSMPRFGVETAARLREAERSGDARAVTGARLAFVADLEDMTARLMRAVRHLGRSDFDLLAAVFVATDRVQHWMWDDVLRSSEGADGEVEDRIRGLYRLVDACVGELAEAAGDGLVLMMSDHGFGRCSGQFSLNRYLVDAGYAHVRGASPLLRLRRALKGSAAYGGLRRLAGGRAVARRALAAAQELDWSSTMAFFVPGTYGVRVNLRGREARGVVEPGEEYERLRSELREAIADAVDPATGCRPVARVDLREDVYDGGLVEWAPDLILVPDEGPGYVLTSGNPRDRRLVSHEPHSRGSHRFNGVLVAHGQGVASSLAPGRADIVDLAPTVMRYLGVSAETEMDGVPLDAVVPADSPEGSLESTVAEAVGAARPTRSEFRANSAPGVGARDAERPSDEEAGDEETVDEEDEVRRRLEDLGYLG